MVATVEPLTAPVEPDEALRRIAFLLERERAGSYRVEAFRKAVVTVRETPGDELRSRHEAGTLQDLAGIGKSTSMVSSRHTWSRCRARRNRSRRAARPCSPS